MAPKSKRIALPGGGAGKVALQPRKKNPPKTAYKKGEPNPHAFKPGQSGNPTGKSPLAEHLLSKNVLIALNNRCPDAIAERLELPKGSSWSQALAAFLLRRAFDGDHWEAAISLIARLTEGNQNSAMQDEFEQMRRAMAAGGGGSGPRMLISFLESDGAGGLSEESKRHIAEVEAKIERGEDIGGETLEEFALSAKTIEAEVEVKPKRKPKALTLGHD